MAAYELLIEQCANEPGANEPGEDEEKKYDPFRGTAEDSPWTTYQKIAMSPRPRVPGRVHAGRNSLLNTTRVIILNTTGTRRNARRNLPRDEKHGVNSSTRRGRRTWRETRRPRRRGRDASRWRRSVRRSLGGDISPNASPRKFRRDSRW